MAGESLNDKQHAAYTANAGEIPQGAVRVVGTVTTIGSGGGPVTIADGEDVAEGATADAAIVTDTSGTLSGKLRGLVKWAFERMPAALGQGTMAQSLSVAIASNQSAVPVNGSGITQPISAATLPLPTGASTAALQLPDGHNVTVDNASLAITAAALPLPAGAATAALQLPDGHNVTVDNASLAITAGALPLPSGAATAALQGTSFGKTITFVSVAQGAAGTTALAGASVGNKHKLVGACLVADAAGTVSFTDGTATLCGAMSLAANAGFVLPAAILPYTETAATNRPLNLVTVTAKVSGMVAILTEP